MSPALDNSEGKTSRYIKMLSGLDSRRVVEGSVYKHTRQTPGTTARSTPCVGTKFQRLLEEMLPFLIFQTLSLLYVFQIYEV